MHAAGTHLPRITHLNTPGPAPVARRVHTRWQSRKLRGTCGGCFCFVDPPRLAEAHRALPEELTLSRGGFSAAENVRQL